MNTQPFLDCELEKMNQMRKVQLPHSFKRIGIGIAIASFLGMLINKFSLDSDQVRSLAKYSMLVGFLILSISKEKIEDELITKLRMQSYSFAFIAAVLYAFVMPITDYLVDFVLPDKEPTMKPLNNFMLLWLLLSIQVLYFHLLKRMR